MLIYSSNDSASLLMSGTLSVASLATWGGGSALLQHVSDCQTSKGAWWVLSHVLLPLRETDLTAPEKKLFSIKRARLCFFLQSSENLIECDDRWILKVRLWFDSNLPDTQIKWLLEAITSNLLKDVVNSRLPQSLLYESSFDIGYDSTYGSICNSSTVANFRTSTNEFNAVCV